jgi:hypothetical protein
MTKTTSGLPEMYFSIAGRAALALWRQQHLSPSLFPV